MLNQFATLEKYMRAIVTNVSSYKTGAHTSGQTIYFSNDSYLVFEHGTVTRYDSEAHHTICGGSWSSWEFKKKMWAI